MSTPTTPKSTQLTTPKLANNSLALTLNSSPTLLKQQQQDIGIPTLNYFCIYTLKSFNNDKFEEEENGDQILYYGKGEPYQWEGILEHNLNEEEEILEVNKLFSPTINHMDLDQQLRQIGLARAMINFSKIFSPGEPIDNVHSKKTRLVIMEPEPDYFIIMSVKLGKRVRVSDQDNKSTVFDYLDQELSDVALRAQVDMAYFRFKLGYGKIDRLIDIVGLDKTKLFLTNFYSPYLNSTLKLDQLDVIAGMDGLTISTITKTTFLSIQSVLKTLQSKFINISAISLFHEGCLVWSGSNLPIHVTQFLTDLLILNKPKDDVKIGEGGMFGTGKRLRDSIINTFKPILFQPINQSDPLKVKSFTPNFKLDWDARSPYYGNDSNQSNPFKLIYSNPDDQPNLLGLYQPWQNGILALFLNDDSLPNDNFINELELYLELLIPNELEFNIINDNLLRNQLKDDISNHYYYAHYNGMNLAIHSNLSNLPIEVNRLLLQLQHQVIKFDLNKHKHDDFNLELLLRTVADSKNKPSWVGVKHSQDATLYFVINKDAGLAEIEGKENINFIKLSYDLIYSKIV